MYLKDSLENLPQQKRDTLSHSVIQANELLQLKAQIGQSSPGFLLAWKVFFFVVYLFEKSPNQAEPMAGLIQSHNILEQFIEKLSLLLTLEKISQQQSASTSSSTGLKNSKVWCRRGSDSTQICWVEQPPLFFGLVYKSVDFAF